MPRKNSSVKRLPLWAKLPGAVCVPVKSACRPQPGSQKGHYCRFTILYQIHVFVYKIYYNIWCLPARYRFARSRSMKRCHWSICFFPADRWRSISRSAAMRCQVCLLHLPDEETSWRANIPCNSLSGCLLSSQRSDHWRTIFNLRTLVHKAEPHNLWGWCKQLCLIILPSHLPMPEVYMDGSAVGSRPTELMYIWDACASHGGWAPPLAGPPRVSVECVPDL